MIGMDDEKQLMNSVLPTRLDEDDDEEDEDDEDDDDDIHWLEIIWLKLALNHLKVCSGLFSNFLRLLTFSTMLEYWHFVNLYNTEISQLTDINLRAQNII